MIKHDEFLPCEECGKQTYFEEIHECFDVRQRKWVFICEKCIEEDYEEG